MNEIKKALLNQKKYFGKMSMLYMLWFNKAIGSHRAMDRLAKKHECITNLRNYRYITECFSDAGKYIVKYKECKSLLIDLRRVMKHKLVKNAIKYRV